MMNPRKYYSDYQPKQIVMKPMTRRELFCNVFLLTEVRNKFDKDPASVIELLSTCGLPDDFLQIIIKAIELEPKLLSQYVREPLHYLDNELDLIRKFCPEYDGDSYYYVHLFSDLKCGYHGFSRLRLNNIDIPCEREYREADCWINEGIATISSVRWGVKIFEIPEKIQDINGKIYPVENFHGNYNEDVETLYVPNCIINLEGLREFPYLHKVILDPNNPRFYFDRDNNLCFGKNNWVAHINPKKSKDDYWFV